MSGFSASRLNRILLQADRAIEVAVESGTWKGDTTRILEPRFRVVYTIEINPEAWRKNVQKFAGSSVQFWFGDSVECVRKLSGLYDRDPVFWYLDAHDIGPRLGIVYEKFPLWDELKVIRDRDQRDTVVVDDVHAFGRKGEWEGVSIPAILELMGDRIESQQLIGDGLVMYLK